MSLSRHAYAIASRLGLPALSRKRNAAPILCFHNVVPDSMAERVGDGSLHLGVTRFAEMLALLNRHYRVLPLAELLERWRRGASLQGCCAITFDDAYTGVLLHALPLLEQTSAPATLFVVTAAAEKPFAFWWDVLGSLGRLSAQRDTALQRWEGRTDLVLKAVTDAPSMETELWPATWAALRTATASGLVTLGAHTRSHANLVAISDEDAEEELRGSLVDLKASVPTALRAIAYPYGRADNRVARLAAEAGFISGLALQQGLLNTGGNPYLVPRINVPASITVPAFDCWVAGVA